MLPKREDNAARQRARKPAHARAPFLYLRALQAPDILKAECTSANARMFSLQISSNAFGSTRYAETNVSAAAVLARTWFFGFAQKAVAPRSWVRPDVHTKRTLADREPTARTVVSVTKPLKQTHRPLHVSTGESAVHKEDTSVQCCWTKVGCFYSNCQTS